MTLCVMTKLVLVEVSDNFINILHTLPSSGATVHKKANLLAKLDAVKSLREWKYRSVWDEATLFIVEHFKVAS